jgi:hypothetical protein
MKKIKLISISILVLIVVLILFLFKQNFVSTFSEIDTAIPEINTKFVYLHLVLFSSDYNYDCMYNTTSEYYKKFINVKTVYYTFSENIKSEYSLINDILYIKGKETYIPGITVKTIKSFEYFKDYSFDYLIRSNISTIVNFNVLDRKLHEKSVDYGGTIADLQWLDEPNGVIDKRYFGTLYAYGTCIILSKKALLILLLYKEFIHYDIIDDLTIGILFKEHTSIVPEEIGNRSITQMFEDDTTFYRNRTSDRYKDCLQMKQIIEQIK